MKPPTYQQLLRARELRGCDNPVLDPNNVRPAKCSSCPMRVYGEGIGSTEMSDFEYNHQQVNLLNNAVNDANQYCHADELQGKVSTHVCRGIRDVQLTIFHSLGVISEPTDKAWRDRLNG